MQTIRRVAMLSMHTCPLANLGGRDTGGMNVYVRELSRELARRSIHVDVFTHLRFEGAPAVVHDIPRFRVIHVPAGPAGPVSRETLYHHVPDFVDNVDRVARDEGIRYDLVHAHYWLSGLAGIGLRRRWDVPLLTMFHTLARVKTRHMDVEETGPDMLRGSAEQRVMDGSDRIVAANTAERDEILDLYRVDARKIRVSPLGVDPAMFFPRDKAACRRDLGIDKRYVVFAVGRMEPLKGIETLLRAMARVFDRRPARRADTVIIVGGGPSEDGDTASQDELARLRALADDLGVAWETRFVGALSQEQLPAYYSAADVCVVPSLYESFGLVAVEAMACGTPVVASDVGGLALTVRDGVNGLKAPPGDAARFAADIGGLLEDAELSARLGRQAAESARAYRWSAVADRVLGIYQSVGYHSRAPRDPIAAPASPLCGSCSY